MEYSLISIHSLSKSRLATLYMIQNMALRQAYNDPSYSPRFTTDELHRKAELKPVTNPRGKHSMIGSTGCIYRYNAL